MQAIIHNPSKLPNTEANISGMLAGLLFPCSMAAVTVIIRWSELLVTVSDMMPTILLVILSVKVVMIFILLVPVKVVMMFILLVGSIMLLVGGGTE